MRDPAPPSPSTANPSHPPSDPHIGRFAGSISSFPPAYPPRSLAQAGGRGEGSSIPNQRPPIGGAATWSRTCLLHTRLVLGLRPGGERRYVWLRLAAPPSAARRSRRDSEAWGASPPPTYPPLVPASAGERGEGGSSSGPRPCLGGEVSSARRPRNAPPTKASPGQLRPPPRGVERLFSIPASFSGLGSGKRGEALGPAWAWPRLAWARPRLAWARPGRARRPGDQPRRRRFARTSFSIFEAVFARW